MEAKSKHERLRDALREVREYFYLKGCEMDEYGNVMHGGDNCCYVLRTIDKALGKS